MSAKESLKAIALQRLLKLDAFTKLPPPALLLLFSAGGCISGALSSWVTCQGPVRDLKPQPLGAVCLPPPPPFRSHACTAHTPHIPILSHTSTSHHCHPFSLSNSLQPMVKVTISSFCLGEAKWNQHRILALPHMEY